MGYTVDEDRKSVDVLAELETESLILTKVLENQTLTETDRQFLQDHLNSIDIAIQLERQTEKR